MYYTTKAISRNEEMDYITYGIAELKNDCVNSCIDVIVSDISPDIDLVNSIVANCNTYEVAPEHIIDVVYDCLV